MTLVSQLGSDQIPPNGWDTREWRNKLWKEKNQCMIFLPVSAIKTPGRTTYIKGTVYEVIEHLNLKNTDPQTCKESEWMYFYRLVPSHRNHINTFDELPGPKSRTAIRKSSITEIQEIGKYEVFTFYDD